MVKLESDVESFMRYTLAIIWSHQRGSDPHNPAVCRRCGNVYWLTADMDRRELTLKMGS